MGKMDKRQNLSRSVKFELKEKQQKKPKDYWTNQINKNKFGLETMIILKKFLLFLIRDIL